MSNILNTSFKSILDNFGNPSVEFKFQYMCDNERKESSILIPINAKNLTEDVIEHYIQRAEAHIKERRGNY